MMNKTILMLSVSCMSFIAGADLCYAGFNPYDTPPVLSAAMLKSHVSTHTSHLTAAHLSSLEDFDKGDNNNLTQLAAACFVTDTTNCSGNEFAGNNADEDNGGVPPGGQGDSDDYDLDNAERCRQEGYTVTSCSEGYKPVNYCPYDNTYFEKCVAICPSNYVTCEKPYYGVGEACDGKYASCECTPCGSGYDNTNIPDGYVQDGETCLDCDGKTKYKIKPNPCDGFMDCGSMGPEAGAKTCLSGSTTKYDNCKPCPNKGTLTSCPSPFTCTYEECSGLWYKTGCQPGYDWNANSQTCTQQCAYKGTLTSCPSPFTCTYEQCSGKYYKSGCKSGYTWNSDSQTCTCKPLSRCDCQCNSATDCSNCKPSSYYDAQCTKIINNGCGGKCQSWGKMPDLIERTCKNADGQIVLTYYLWTVPPGFSYYTQVYCDGQRTKAWLTYTVMDTPEQDGSVDWPAEKVWCNKKITINGWEAKLGSATVWNEEVDYNTEYCGGTASKITFVVDGDKCSNQ